MEKAYRLDPRVNEHKKQLEVERLEKEVAIFGTCDVARIRSSET